MENNINIDKAALTFMKGLPRLKKFIKNMPAKRLRKLAALFVEYPMQDEKQKVSRDEQKLMDAVNLLIEAKMVMIEYFFKEKMEREQNEAKNSNPSESVSVEGRQEPVLENSSGTQSQSST